MARTNREGFTDQDRKQVADPEWFSFFCFCWAVSSDLGQADALYSQEFWRVLQTWWTAGKPVPIGDFIRAHANCPPAERT